MQSALIGYPRNVRFSNRPVTNHTSMLLLHISDIHFRKTEVGEPDDPNLALRSDMIRDVKQMRRKIGRPANGILVTGDIAFAGLAAEYDFAFKWLEEKLCPAAGCQIEDVFVVPGNHDVDRTAEVGPAQVMARENLRKVIANRLNAELRKWLHDRTSANVLFGPIDNYNRFAAKFLCLLGPYVDNEKPLEKGNDGTATKPVEPPAKPFARRDLKLNDGSVLRLWGFNSVLVSDANDAERLMLIDPAASQIEEEDGIANLTMCHHPFGWIRNSRALEDRLNAVAKIQLFGHEHTRRMDEAKRYIRIRAGALQPDRDEPDWKPGYNWIDVSVGEDKGKRTLVVKVWARMHEVSQFITIPDPDDNEIWENSFVLPAWKAPSLEGTESKKEVVVVRVTESPMMQTSTPITIRSVIMKFFKLKEHEQRLVIAKMKLDRPGDRDLKDYELVINTVRRSEQERRLPELDALLEETLSGPGRS
jgi:predicted phosphodiesterase